MEVPTFLWVISLPRSMKVEVTGTFWFGGSSKHASIQELFSVREMRSDTSISEMREVLLRGVMLERSAVTESTFNGEGER